VGAFSTGYAIFFCPSIFVLLLISSLYLCCRPEKTQAGADKKNRPKDVFGRPLPTEQEFEVLKNAPRYIVLCLVY